MDTVKAIPALYTYAWSNGDSGAFVALESPNTYTVTATDSLGCKAVDTVTVLLDGLGSWIQDPGMQCYNDSFYVMAQPQPGPYVYNWFAPARVLLHSSVQPFLHTVIPAPNPMQPSVKDTYYLYMVDTLTNCSDTASIIVIANACQNLVSIYPNPGLQGQQLTVVYDVQYAQVAELEILNALGEQLMLVPLKPDEFEVVLESNLLAPGMYLVRLSANQMLVEVLRFVIKN